jgi:hypothetical protein
MKQKEYIIMITHKSILNLWLILLAGVLSGCVATNNTTIGNGRVDALEAATLKVAVGLALTEKPQAIKPSYDVTSALLGLTQDNIAQDCDVNSIIALELNKLELDPMTKASVMELAELIKIYIVTILDGEGIPADQRYVVAIDLIRVVHEAAKTRLDMTSPK